MYLRTAGALGGSDALSPVYSFARMFTAVAVLVLVVCIGLSSYAYASDDVLPDTVLYPVRQVIEEVEVKLAVTPVQKRKVVDKLVERRKKEVKILQEKKKPVPPAIKKFLKATAAIPATTTRSAITEVLRPKKQNQQTEREEDDAGSDSARDIKNATRLFIPRFEARRQVATATKDLPIATTTRRYLRPSRELKETMERQRIQNEEREKREERDALRKKRAEELRRKRLERLQEQRELRRRP